jgi:signal transduction histidine kinase
LSNLLVNGIEAMCENDERARKLSISTVTEGPGTVQVAVRDRGSGIDPRIGECIFDPFFTTKPSGMGMGLTITRTIVEAHGGRLWASPRPGGGAELCFSLPALDGVPV